MRELRIALLEGVWVTLTAIAGYGLITAGATFWTHEWTPGQSIFHVCSLFWWMGSITVRATLRYHGVLEVEALRAELDDRSMSPQGRFDAGLLILNNPEREGTLTLTHEEWGTTRSFVAEDWQMKPPLTDEQMDRLKALGWVMHLVDAQEQDGYQFYLEV